MISKVLLILAIGFSRAIWAQDCPQDSFYVNEVAKCIHPDNDVSPMAYAEFYCQAFGGNLLSMHNTFYNSLLTGIQLTRLNGNRGFLGARRAPNGTWSWTDGTPFDYAKWAPGEPGTGDCAYLDSNDYNWKAIDCSVSLPYLCGLPNITWPDCTTPPPNPISCPKGSIYIDEIRACLHADNNAVSLFLAEKYCQAFNGHLFSIHDGDTDNFLTGISFTLINGDQFYIGGKKNGSSYGWTDGSPFDYNNWGQGEPQFECVVIQRETASWITVNCSTPLPFMCQIRPIYNGGCTTTTLPSTTTTDETSTIPLSVTYPTMAPLNCLPKESQPLYTCYQGWQYFPKTGYYYLLFFDSSFSKGEAYCVSQGAHLASIHSLEEDDFVSGLCCDSDCSCRRQGPDGYSTAGAVLIGAHKVNGAWAWTDGTPWDYQQAICKEGGGDFLVTKDTDCTADCGEGFGGWVGVEPPDAESVPYFVCKKKTL